MALIEMRYLFVLASAAVLCFRLGDSQEAAESSNDTKQCIKQFLEWCKNNSYPEEEGSVSIISTNMYVNGRGARVYCRTDFDGTLCRKNKSTWYHCFPDKTLQYKGQLLTEDSPGDSEICDTKKYALRTRVNNNFNSTAFQEKFSKGMEKFNHQMANFRKQMQAMSQRMSSSLRHMFHPPRFWWY